MLRLQRPPAVDSRPELTAAYSEHTPEAPPPERLPNLAPQVPLKKGQTGPPRNQLIEMLRPQRHAAVDSHPQLTAAYSKHTPEAPPPDRLPILAPQVPLKKGQTGPPRGQLIEMLRLQQHAAVDSHPQLTAASSSALSARTHSVLLKTHS